MTNDHTYQTLHFEKADHATKFCERLCRKGYFFICQMSRPYIGRLVTISSAFDFQVERKLMAGLEYRVHPNPDMHIKLSNFQACSNCYAPDNCTRKEVCLRDDIGPGGLESLDWKLE